MPILLALQQFFKGLVILSFRICSVVFLIFYPLLHFVLNILNRSWFKEPIIQGIQLTLSPLKDLRERYSFEAIGMSTDEESSAVLLLPLEPPKKDINKASVEELRAIEGVGFVRALEIVEYRERFGDYRRMEELGLIKGIGSQTFKLICENYEIKENIVRQ